jgi:hypothetical protein
MKHSFPRRQNTVARYDIRYFDWDWVEIPEMYRTMLTAHEMLIEVDFFNQLQQRRLKGMDVEVPTGEFPWFLSLEVADVEV